MKQPEYLEIYPSEVAAKKISKHLDKMLSVKPRVYRKTLLRYKVLAQLLLECVIKIVRMLQSEVLLSSSNAEFQELSTEFDTEQIEELKDSVTNLGNLIEKKPSSENRKIAGETLSTYKAVFNEAADHDFGYAEANECAKLLDYWIRRRFSGFNPNFKYQIKQLPIWATYIIVAYGKYHSVGGTIKFTNDFKTWCDELDNDASNCWALPYSIFSMTKDFNPNNFTLDSMVIYDILINGCLYKLMDIKIPMDSFYIAQAIKTYRPENSHDVITRFTKQRVLAETLNLHPTDVAEEDYV